MTDKLTAAEIAETRELIAKATKGPWQAPTEYVADQIGLQIRAVFTPPDDDRRHTVFVCEVHQQRTGDEVGPANAAFIAASRTLVPRLLSALDDAGRLAAIRLAGWEGEQRAHDETRKCASQAELALAAARIGMAKDAETIERLDGLVDQMKAERDAALKERDEARRMYCERAQQPGLTARMVAETHWPADADRLFGPEKEGGR